MTQSSRPQAEHAASFPAPSDSGPYSGDQWAQRFSAMYTPDGVTTQGPIVRYLNELEPTDNGSTIVQVDTGAGLVNGHLLVSSEQETFAIPAGPVATRIDRVVIVENNTNVEVTQTAAGRPLLFPNDLSEYTATPGVPAYSARLAIVRGADGAGLPAIDQITALYMVELYRYTINNVPTISSTTDYREFALFGSTVGNRNVHIYDNYGYNQTDGTDILLAGGAAWLPFIDNKLSYSRTIFVVPADYKQNFTAKAIITFPPATAGNVYSFVDAIYGACGENPSTHSDGGVYAAEAIVAVNFNCVSQITLASVTAGDIVQFQYRRDATNVLDTTGATASYYGLFIEYEAKS